MASAASDAVRAGTDRRVLELLYDGPRSRAELAALGGFSKPTASESVRRLETRGLVGETGQRRHGVGRTATLVGIRPDAGTVLAVLIEPSGVRANCLDAGGVSAGATEVPLPADHSPRQVATALRAAAKIAARSSQGPIRCAAVSAADPVRRSDGRLVELPDAPFLVGSLDPRKALSSYTQGEVIVDNDVNWAARAEADAREGVRNFGYVYLGSGLGGAIVSDGDVRRGHHGFAGEIAHLIVAGGDGRAVTLTDAIADLGVRQPDSTAIDVDRMVRTLHDPAQAAMLGSTLVGVISAFIAVADPELVVIAGPWAEAVLPSLERALEDCSRRVPVVGPIVEDAPEQGLRAGAIASLRARLIAVADEVQ